MEGKSIVISSSFIHGYSPTRKLTKKLRSEGIDTFLTPPMWPRDEIFVHKDGFVEFVEKGSPAKEYIDHFAWNGGTYLLGDDFAIVSETANPNSKVKRTKEVLGVEELYLENISLELDSLFEIRYENCSERVFSRGFPHIDLIYNIGNMEKLLFTYNKRELIKKGEEMANKVGYDLKVLPLKEAKYASVGFLEFEDKMIVDCRAEQTKKILKESGYQVISTPLPLKKTNKNMGSLRCITNEIPFRNEDMKTNKVGKLGIILKFLEDKCYFFDEESNDYVFRYLNSSYSGRLDV